MRFACPNLKALTIRSILRRAFIALQDYVDNTRSDAKEQCTLSRIHVFVHGCTIAFVTWRTATWC